MRIAGRVGALILGLLGVVFGFMVNLIGVLHGHLTDVTTHGIRGMLLVLVGLIGAIIVMFSPIAAAVLFAIAGIGFFFVVGPFAAIIVALPFVLAAVMAYLDRRPTTAHTA